MLQECGECYYSSRPSSLGECFFVGPSMQLLSRGRIIPHGGDEVVCVSLYEYFYIEKNHCGTTFW
ncbi:hypothetical protein DAI22_04g229000 [Oryza sativa Japonica Group]|jgi:hypothetical protein|nr:hypothetical protein DAI22_04g229000 [Oryza sativa Japonica Group]